MAIHETNTGPLDAVLAIDSEESTLLGSLVHVARLNEGEPGHLPQRRIRGY